MPAPTDILLDGSVLDGVAVNATLAENGLSGLLIGRLSATDPDTGDTITFALLDDAGGAVFLDGDQLRLAEGALLDAATAPGLTVTVSATDGTGGTITRSLVIAVTNMVDHVVIHGTPGDDTLASPDFGGQYFRPGAGNDTITTDDQDTIVLSGTRADYAISVDGGGDPYGGDPYGGGGGGVQITVQDLRAGGPDGTDLVLTEDSVSFRFADGDYSLEQVQSTGQTGLALNGRVLDNDAYLEENRIGTTELGQLSLRNRPGGEIPVITTFETLHFEAGNIFPTLLTGTDNPFAIDSNGVLTATGPLDFEAGKLYALRLFYTDGAGSAGFDIVNVELLDTDDAPKVASAPGLTQPFDLPDYTDTATDVLIGRIVVTDQDGTVGTLRYTLGGADADKFLIIDDELYLKAGTTLRTSAPFDFDVTIAVHDDNHPPETAIVHDLDIGVRVPEIRDSLAGSYVAPQTIKLFIAPGGLLVDESGFVEGDFGLPEYTSLGFSAAQISAIERALDDYAAVTALTFNLVTDAAQADFVLLGADNTIANFTAYWAVGGGTLTLDGTGHAVEGWGHFDLSSTELQGDWERGSRAYYVLLHEFAHSLGLGHPHSTEIDTVVMEGVTEDFGSYGAFELNQAIFTVTSYNAGWETGPMGTPPLTTGNIATPAAIDIAILQERYGANLTSNGGDDVYVLPDNDTFFATIWDTGGEDTIRYDGSAPSVISLQAATVDYSTTGGGAPSFVLSGFHGGFTIARGVVIEHAQGGSGSDRLLGNEVANRLIGNGGSDFLNGEGGADTLIGGTGGDMLSGGTDDDDLQGEAGNDTMDGGSQDDTLQGGNGNDFMLGGFGTDSMLGGNGNDTLLGGGGADRLTGANNTDRLFGEAGNDTLTGGSGNDLLSGGDNADRLEGGFGNDQLRGGKGNDTLIGGGGNDRLAGGAGADDFVFAGNFGSDTVDGFAPGEDRLVFAAGFEVTGFDAFLAASAQVGAAQVIYDLDGDGINRIQFNGLNLALLGSGDVMFL